jgi:hypothetical protein
MALLRRRQIAWAKTSHEIPDRFDAAARISDLVLAPAEADSTAVGGQR